MFQPKVGISIASLLPWSWGLQGAYIVEKVVRASGLDGIQAVPLRGWTYETMKVFNPNQVISMEGSWHPAPGKEWGDSKRKNRLPSVDDVLFGIRRDALRVTDAMRTWYPRAIVVDEEGGLMETSPRNCVLQREYLRHPQGVCFDTWHVIEPRKDDGAFITTKPFAFAQELVSAGQIKLVHVQTRRRKEFEDLMARKGRVYELLKIVAHAKTDVILELPPTYLFQWPHRLTRLLCRLKDTILSAY